MSDNTADVTLERILELKGNDTQDAFGKKIKMSQANVSKMLKGTPPSAATLIEIAKAYHVSVDWLLGLSEQKEHTSNLDVSNLTYSDVMAVIDKLYENGTIQMGYDYNSYGNESDALLNIDEAGNVSYGTPVPIPGAVSIGLDANGEPSNFYADGYAYYTISNNMGYEGDLEIAMVPESFRVDVLKEQLDDNKVLVENANVETANFALLFEFDGDIKKIRHVLYKCAASRPSIESQTNEDEIEVQTETLSLKATPLANGFVKAKTGDDTTDAVYQDWYKAVYMTSTTTNTESEAES